LAEAEHVFSTVAVTAKVVVAVAAFAAALTSAIAASAIVIILRMDSPAESVDASLWVAICRHILVRIPHRNSDGVRTFRWQD
jgi:hypothetical protein